MKRKPRYVDYSVLFVASSEERPVGWYIVERGPDGEIWRGPFKTEAEARARLAQYGYGRGRAENMPKPG